MSRNTEAHFGMIPTMDHNRSKFNIQNGHKTTFNAGELICSYWAEVVPGDTCEMNMSHVTRMATPLYPIYDNLFQDNFWFFVPTRLVWDHWAEFWGENKSKWYQTVEYVVPHITTNSNNKFAPKSLADYMGEPVNQAGLSVNALPYRAVCKIWNDWFRSEALQDEIPFTTGDSDHIADNTTQYGGALPIANKYFDYFTSALNQPQKGPEVKLPLGSFAPVGTRQELSQFYKDIDLSMIEPINWNGLDTSTAFTQGTFYRHLLKADGNDTLGYPTFHSAGNSTAQTGGSTTGIYPTNLWANLAGAGAASINEVRQAFALQHYYEVLARAGSRYTEIIRALFGVTSPDARLQRSEFLGSRRVPIQISQVLQTSGTTSSSPQGNTGAYSQTVDYSHYFTKSFTEHGFIICLSCVRYDHSYEQGVPREHSRRKFTDYFIPQFQGVGDQPVYNKELYAQGTATDNQVFGYQERYGEYKWKQNQISGAFRSSYPQTLNAWHLGDYYSSLPILGETWIKETPTNINRVLAVSSEVENQFIADFYFTPTWVRPMKIYSIPGLNYM